MPRNVAIIHCPGHQKGDGPVERGNQMADQATKAAAQGPMILTMMAPDAGELSWGKQKRAPLDEEEGYAYLTNIHALTHLGPKKMNWQPSPCITLSRGQDK